MAPQIKNVSKLHKMLALITFQYKGENWSWLVFVFQPALDYLNIMFEGCYVALFPIQQVKPLVGSRDRFADGPGNA